ncbi:ribonuclease HII [Nanchangia anserum]|uniref:Ribonuclease n=1 Tax=Nanchangia anserum TaxID=2692125 RepID=A0A8I0GA33_9ACTO|nr:ribonuclease HII [Nanchangia anserum]MBD3688993.1 ribonuclease HII [Nanchangia anserum]QOX81241.1 ribonuclease HII [Nanchangia anserum]
MREPTRDLETSLLATYPLIGGMDEVGRGALAGPVCVGVAVVGPDQGDAPEGLRDSKLLTPRRREQLAPHCERWVKDWAVGEATPDEIDRWGIIAALRLAGRRALTQVSLRGNAPGIVIVDGSHNWLRGGEADLLAPPDHPDNDADIVAPPPSMAQVKADRDVCVVAAASVIAKVRRDAAMVALADPGYDWARNKGYASPAHVAGLTALGPSPMHRRSWRLPGVDQSKE